MGARLRKLGKNGNYFAVFYDGKRTPKEKSVPLGTTLKSAALKKFSRWVEDYEHGRRDPWAPSAEAERLTARAAFARFLEDRSHLRKSTLAFYRSTLDRLPLPANLFLSDLSAAHLQPYIDAATAPPKRKGDPPRPISQATRRKRWRCLKTFTLWAVKAGHLERNVMDDVRAPRPESQVPRFLTPADVARLFAVIDEAEAAGSRSDDTWLKDFITLALYTGARRNELLFLRWRDVDLSSGIVAIRNTQAHSTKTGKERGVPLVGDARKVVGRRYQEKTAASAVIGLDDPVLTDKAGRAIKPHRASSRFKHYIRAAGLDDRLRLHDLRHTCASWMVQRGESLYTVQAILGHSTPVVAQRYSHLAPDAMRAAMERAFGNG